MTLPLLTTPTPIGTLAERLGLPRRAVERAVEQMRLDGLPVCSDGRGVWIGTAGEVEATLRSLRGRLVTQYRTYLALRRTLRSREQLRLWA